LILTDHPHPLDSPDYLRPWGAKNDDTHCPGFVEWVRESFGPHAKHLDLGCAGGGLVADMRDAGFYSIGIEGSEEPKRLGRPAWLKYPEAFFHADIGKPFGFPDWRFDVISAWEVLEHIPESDLPVFFNNVWRHLVPGGAFVGTVSMNFDKDYHQTVKPFEWWRAVFLRERFELCLDLPESARARTDGGSFCFRASFSF